MSVFNLFNFQNIGCGKIEYDSQVAKSKVFYFVYVIFSLLQNLNENRWFFSDAFSHLKKICQFWLQVVWLNGLNASKQTKA